MSDQDVRDGLAALVSDEPPLHFDPDALIAVADAAVRRRRAYIGAGGATLVIAAAAVVLPISLRGAESVEPAARPPATSSPAPRPARQFGWPPKGVLVPHYSVEQLIQRAHKLQGYAQTAVPRAVPDAESVRAELFQGEAAGDYHEGQLTLNSAVHLTIDGARTALAIQIDTGASASSPAENCAHNKCRFAVLTDGSALVVSSVTMPDGEKILTVQHYRSDGVAVMVSGYNGDAFTDAKPHYLPKIPVTEQQLTKLATDPRFTL